MTRADDNALFVEGEWLDPLPSGEEEGEGAAPSEERGLTLYDPLQHYLAEVRRYPHLSREEERELAIRYREHQDMEAAARLILSNLRVVVAVAMQYRHIPLPLMDLIQEGNVGLMQAVKRFDPYKGLRLYTYAVWWIRAYILRYILNNWRLVKLGTTQTQRKLFFNLRKEQERLEALGYEAGPALLAEKLDVREKDVIEMEQRLGNWEISLADPVGEDGEGTVADLLPAPAVGVDEGLAQKQLREILREGLRDFLRNLGARDRDILENRILADPPMTLQEISERHGISRERARQLEQKILKNLRAVLRERLGRDAELLGLPAPRGAHRPVQDGKPGPGKKKGGG